MNWLVFTLCAMDCILFALYRGLHFVMEFNDDYSNPVWWILMIFTAVINVIILNKITKKKVFYKHYFRNSGRYCYLFYYFNGIQKGCSFLYKHILARLGNV